MIITIKMLKTSDIDPRDILAFEQLFGDAAEVTEENVEKALNANLYLTGFAVRFFTPAAYDDFIAARDAADVAYEEAMASYRYNHAEATADAWEKYRKCPEACRQTRDDKSPEAMESHRKAKEGSREALASYQVVSQAVFQQFKEIVEQARQEWTAAIVTAFLRGAEKTDADRNYINKEL